MKKLLILLMFSATSAFGMIYTWTDSAGIKHFANKEHEVPARYKTKAKILYPEQADTTTPAAAISLPASPPVNAVEPPQKTPEPPANRGGRRSRGSRSSDE